MSPALTWARRILSGLLLAAISLGVFPAAAHHAAGPVRVAAVLSLTGSAARVGTPQLRALQLYVDRLNEAGGLLTHKLELFHADDESDPRKAAAAARRLAVPETADFLIGGSTTSTALAILPVMQAAKIPFLALATGSRISDQTRGWIFRAPPTESQSVLRIFEELSRLGVKRVALVSADSESGRTARRDVRQLTDAASLYYRKAGISLAADRVFPPQDANAAAQALEQALRAADVGAVVAVAFGDAAVAIARRRVELGSAVPVYFTHAAASPNFAARVGTATEGLRITVPPILVAEQLPDSDPQKKRILEFAAAYRARHGEVPPPAAGYAVDALMLAANAVQVSRSLDFTHLRQALEGTREFVGVTGTYSFWATDHGAADPKALRMAEIRAGALRLLD